MKDTCECGEKGMFLHSRCCYSHFEGIILGENEFIVVCEKCGKYVGHIEVKEEFYGRKYFDGTIMKKEWVEFAEKRKKEQEEKR